MLLASRVHVAGLAGMPIGVADLAESLQAPKDGRALRVYGYTGSSHAEDIMDEFRVRDVAEEGVIGSARLDVFGISHRGGDGQVEGVEEV